MTKLNEGRGFMLFGNSRANHLEPAEIALMVPFMECLAEIQASSKRPVVFAPMFWVRVRESEVPRYA
jgi:hypothetical protein